MKVLLVTTNNRLKATQILAHRNNEIYPDDIKKLLSGTVETIYATKISRLAYLYIMFAEKGAVARPVNKLASLLVNADAGEVRGDVVLARINHLGAGAKTYALEDHEVKTITERLSKMAASAKIEITIADQKR